MLQHHFPNINIKCLYRNLYYSLRYVPDSLLGKGKMGEPSLQINMEICLCGTGLGGKNTPYQ